MKHWEKFASENAEYFILTHKNIDFSKKEGQDYFFNSGRADTQSLLKNIEDYFLSNENALEIGCGIGRLAFAHAEKFNSMSVVDISETMLKKLNSLAKLKNVKNIKSYFPKEDWDKKNYYDYIYSYLVFQHIDDIEVIKLYVQKISKAIKSNGIIQLHFDTRKLSVGYILRSYIPDTFLPKNHKKGIRRIRRSANEIREIFYSNQLTILKEINQNSKNHFFILKPN